MADTPYNIYHRPVNVFTARFIGSPPMNVIKVVLDGRTVRMGDKSVELTDAWLEVLSRTKKNQFYMGIRPEDVVLSARKERNSIPVSIKYVENYGNKLGAYFDMGGSECIGCVDLGIGIGGETQVYWKLLPSKLSFFHGDSQQNVGYPQVYDTVHSGELINAEQLLGMQSA